MPDPRKARVALVRSLEGPEEEGPFAGPSSPRSPLPPKPHHAAGVPPSDHAQARVVPVEDRRAVWPQTLEDLGLGVRDRVHRGKELQVDGGDARDRGHVGLGEHGESADLPRCRHAHLQNGRGVRGREAQEGEGQAVLVVEIAFGLEHRPPRGEKVRRHVLRGRLADRPRHRHDRERGFAAHVTGEIGEAFRGVGHPHPGEAGGRLRVPVDESHAGSALRGLGEEVVPVEPRALDRDEEGARREGAGVDRDAGEGDLARHPSREDPAGAGEDVREGQGLPQRHRRHLFPPAPARRARTSRATWRSSNGTVRSRST
jgi:hypothetical protein